MTLGEWVRAGRDAPLSLAGAAFLRAALAHSDAAIDPAKLEPTAAEFRYVDGKGEIHHGLRIEDFCPGSTTPLRELVSAQASFTAEDLIKAVWICADLEQLKGLLIQLKVVLRPTLASSGVIRIHLISSDYLCRAIDFLASGVVLTGEGEAVIELITKTLGLRKKVMLLTRQEAVGREPQTVTLRRVVSWLGRRSSAEQGSGA